MSDNPEAWIRLLVKYKGKCKECGKDIPAGEYALWSRTSKAIKHVKCELAPAQQNSATGKTLLKTKEETTVSICFVCEKPVGCAECGLEEGCDKSMVSHACICDDCLSDEDSYKNYQDRFVKRMHKVAKVKI